jgi:putative phage-type endonuclease
MQQRIKCENREVWLATRGIGIGASEAAAAVGMSPWQTPLELWKLKIGAIPPKDLSGNLAVEQGNRMESVLRDFFMGMHSGEYTLFYHPYDIIFQEDRPWLFATLDGELTDAVGRMGILEIKTATPNGKAGWDKWANGNLPQNYYIQTLHQMQATGYEFVRLFAALYSVNGDITLREYEIERADVTEDMEWLLEQETEFWGKVQRGEMPAMPLTL